MKYSPSAAWWRISDKAADLPLAYWAYSRIHPALRRLRINRRTRLIIEGFPRSGNTYAVVAFEQVNTEQVGHIAHHTHSSVTILKGVQSGVPVILLVRDPTSAVRSLCARYPGLSPHHALGSYVKFHERLLPVLSRMFIAPFDEVVSDYGRAIHRVNVRYERSFNTYTKSPESEAAVQGRVEQVGRVDSWRARAVERGVARPSRERQRDYGGWEIDERSAALLARAESLHVQFLQHAASQ